LVSEEGNDTTTSQVDMTTDGGATWTASPKIEPIGPGITAADFGLRHIVCSSATECVAVAEEDYFTDTPPVPVLVAYDTFASSTDGGMTWHQMALPNGGGAAVACPSPTHCLVATDQVVESLTTTDGGESWTIADEQVPELDSTFYDISCPTTMKCVAVQFFPSSNEDAIFTSNDGGSTWDGQPIATAFKADAIELDSVSCPSPTSCWTVGSVPSPTGFEDGSIILHSVTGGVAWPSISSISPAQGPVGGGTVVTITGAGFFGSPIVTFGSGPGTEVATNVTVLSPTELQATVPPCDCTPPPPEGVAVPVTVTMLGLGASPPNPNYEFTYLSSTSPGVTLSLTSTTPGAFCDNTTPGSPVCTGMANGTVLTVTGTDFSPGALAWSAQCSSDPSQPVVLFLGQVIPVSCSRLGLTTIPSSGPNKGDFSDTDTLGSGTMGPPGTGLTPTCTEGSTPIPSCTTSGNAVIDAASYPCPPTPAQQDAGDTCVIAVGDMGGDHAVGIVLFSQE